jgi:hypothetical protein
VASVNHTTVVVFAAHLAFHELQQFRSGKMKLSSHEPQQAIIQLPLPVTDPGMNARTATVDDKPQHRVVSLRLFEALPR